MCLAGLSFASPCLFGPWYSPVPRMRSGLGLDTLVHDPHIGLHLFPLVSIGAYLGGAQMFLPLSRPPSLSSKQLAARAGIAVVEARAILAMEAIDRKAHAGRPVYNGYDYDTQAWCECSYCTRAPV